MSGNREYPYHSLPARYRVPIGAIGLVFLVGLLLIIVPIVMEIWSEQPDVIEIGYSLLFTVMTIVLCAAVVAVLRWIIKG